MSSKKRGVNKLLIVVIIILVLAIVIYQFGITGNVIKLFQQITPPPQALITDGTGLNASYYDNQDFTNLKLNRIDPNVDYTYGYGSPDSSIGSDTFSIRWEGYIIPLYSELYTFYTYSNDGMRIYVNNQLVVTDWSNHAAREKSGTIALQAGTLYPIKIEYYEGSNTAEVEARWSSNTQVKQVIPQSAFRTEIDTGLPSVSITFPLQNQIITTFPFTVNADASDSDGISQVDLYTNIDPVSTNGIHYGSDYDAPYSFTLESGILGNGYQTVMAIASDTKENTKKSNVVGFYVEDFTQIPSQVLNLRVTPTHNSISLIWDDSYGETSYLIERSKGKTGFTRIATLPQNSVTYTDTNVNPDTVYYYRIIANNSVGFTFKITSIKTPPRGIPAQCENGLDDDNDGLIDYPADPGCSSTSDNDERNSDKPDETNTGPIPGIPLTLNDAADEITVDGTVLENFYTRGGYIIDIRASNVILRNFRHNRGGGMYAIQATYGAKNITIENAEIYNADNAIIYGANMVIKRSHIHEGGADAIKVSSGGNIRIEDSYLHGIGKNENSHADGIQITHSDSDYIFLRNNFDMPCCYLYPPYKGSTIIISTGGANPRNVLFDGNWINGGNWAIQTGSPRVINNIFGKDCNFGLMNGNPIEWSNNRWEDSGQLITLEEAKSGGDKYCRG